MTYAALAPTFELQLQAYERNRMYPLGYRKESPMTELNMDHLNAICHAEFYLHQAATQFLEPHMRAQLDDDLLRLAELKLFLVLHTINENKLFPVEAKPNGYPDSHR